MGLKLLWVTRSFLDYRIPVFEALDDLVGGSLYLVYSGDYVPQTTQDKTQRVLGSRAIGMSGEWKIGKEDQHFMANQNISLRFQPGLLKQIRKIKPDVLICDGFFKWTFPALFYRFIFRVPVVINYERTFHTERHVQWFRTLYRQLVVKFTDAMDCNGKFCVDYSKSLGMPAEMITTGHMSADTKELSLKAQRVGQDSIDALREKWNIQGLLVLYVGRLHSRKGCTELLRAWAEMEEHHLGKATLLLVGAGKEREQFERFCKSRQLRNVRFAGAVPYDKIYKFYAAADVFIIPTLEDNWSLVVPEAMACGLPILCSKYNGCWPELVIEERNGWVFDPLDQGEILHVLKNCISDNKKLIEMGKESLEIVKEHGPDNSAKSILDACTLAIKHIQGDT